MGRQRTSKAGGTRVAGFWEFQKAGSKCPLIRYVDYQERAAPSGGAAEGEVGPDVAESCNQRVDISIAVQWRGGQAQALGAARHSRVVDRLNIDVVLPQQHVGCGPAT